jgi:NitT/TauT family transport system permease protein
MLIAVIIFFPASVTIRDGVKEISVQYLELAQAYHLTQTQILRDILWPFILPRIFSSLRITLGISLSVLFISENYAATYGLGYYIMNNWVMAQYVGMYAGIVLLSLLGLTMYVTSSALCAW